jgi:hypothetical protein
MPGGGIGRRAPSTWPLRSSDVTPLDFLWGYVKILVYHVRNNDLQQLKARIRNAVAIVTHITIRNTWTKVNVPAVVSALKFSKVRSYQK